jgi:hypothetical protein
MAGKSGLNLTKDEPVGRSSQACAYRQASSWLAPMLAAFGTGGGGRSFPRRWASRCSPAAPGRVFPGGMKASPLLRAWMRADRGGVAAWLALDRMGRNAHGRSRRRTAAAGAGPEASPSLRWAAQAGRGWDPMGRGPGLWRHVGVDSGSVPPGEHGVCRALVAAYGAAFGAPVKSTALRAADGSWRRGEAVISRARGRGRRRLRGVG